MSIRCRIRNSYHRGLRDKLLDRKKWHSWWYIKVHINKLPFVVWLEQTISNMHILSTKFSFGLHAGQARSSLIRKSFQVVVQRNLSTSAVVSVILLSIGNKQSIILYSTVVHTVLWTSELSLPFNQQKRCWCRLQTNPSHCPPSQVDHSTHS